jgi:hypothetical protein
MITQGVNRCSFVHPTPPIIDRYYKAETGDMVTAYGLPASSAMTLENANLVASAREHNNGFGPAVTRTTTLLTKLD